MTLVIDIGHREMTSRAAAAVQIWVGVGEPLQVEKTAPS
jgi:hypothetical protein